MKPRLNHVITYENIIVTDDGMKAVVTLANGDMRKALNILQSTSLAHTEVDEDSVYTCTGKWILRNVLSSSTLKYTVQDYRPF